MFSKIFPNRGGSSLGAAALAAVAVAGLAGTGAVSASVVNVEFWNNGNANSGNFQHQQGAYTGDSLTSPTWNVLTVDGDVNGSGQVVPVTVNGLVDSTNTATGVGITFGYQGWFNAYKKTSPANNLLDSYIASVAGYVNNNIELTGLTDNGNYELYLYGSSAGYGAKTLFKFTAGTATPAAGSNAYTSASEVAPGAFALNTNYVIFDVTASATGTITIVPYPTSGTPSITTHNTGNVNGLQLVSAPVPEPASLALVAAGGLGLLLLGRKRKFT